MIVEPVTKEKTIVKGNTHGDISGAYMQIQIPNNKASQNLKAGNMEGIGTNVVTINDPKCRRTEEHNAVQPTGLSGSDMDTIMDTQNLISMDQKNLLQAGAARQACQPL